MSLLLIGTGSAFAYYPDEYDAGPSGWAVLFAILYFAVGVLNVVLFFKIWRMTDDVKSLKDSIQNNRTNLNREAVLDRVRDLYFTGHVEKAYNTINAYIFNQLSNKMAFCATDDNGNVFFTDGWDYKTQTPKDTTPEEAIKETLAENEKLYELIGKEMPPYLKNFTYEQYAAFNVGNEI